MNSIHFHFNGDVNINLSLPDCTCGQDSPGYFKKGTTATAADKMMKVLEAESHAGQKPHHTA